MNALTRLMTRGVVGPLAVAAAVGGAGLAVTATASASPGGSPVTGHVYVDDNTAGTNTIAGFARHADGALTALPGSPYNAGGAGTGTGLASQGAVQLAGGGRYLLAVDAGSNQISVLRVHHDGSLEPTEAVPSPSGGAEPVSIAEHDGLVYVANAGPAETNYTGFSLTPRGHLVALPGSTVSLPSNAQPGDVLFNSTGTRLVGTRIGTSEIDSFAVDQNGLLSPAAGSPYAAQGVGPFGSSFRPTRPNQLFVTNAHNAPGASTVSSFFDLRGGTLSSIGGSPVANGQSGTCWVVANPDGRSIYTVNTGSGTITSYAVAPNGSLTVAASTPIPNGAGNSVDAGISPDGQHLYIDGSKSDSIAEFAVHGTQLRQVAAAPVALPAGAAAAGIAVQ